MRRLGNGTCLIGLIVMWFATPCTLAEEPGGMESVIGSVADLPRRTTVRTGLQRLDGLDVLFDWAAPGKRLDPSLGNIDVHYDGPIRYQLLARKGVSYRVVLALCEGWWNEPGKRVQEMYVEGADPRTVDTVADIGKNKAAAFWFDARDTNGDGAIQIRVEAAAEASDKNTILNGLWVFETTVAPDSAALLAGQLNPRALERTPVLDDGKEIVVPMLSGRAAVARLRLIHQATVDRFRRAYEDPAVRVKPRLIPLPPGEVQPTGWLEDWARAAADGITGHLDQRAAVYANGYKGKHFEAMGVKDHGTGWPLEQCAYWLDGLVRLAYVLQDETLIRKAVSRLDMVVDGVNRGGESLVYWQPKSILTDTFNNWAHSHMGRALVAYYQATGEKRILDALVKAYRDYPLPDIPMDGFYPVSGAVNLDPMLDTYALSGDREILSGALAYAGRDAFGQLVQNWVAGDVPEGHGVIYYEDIRVPALLYPWTGDARTLNASRQALEYGVDHYGLPLGLVSSEEFLSGIGSTRFVEACNVAAGSWTYLSMLRLTGERTHADRIEKIIFNAAPATISRDFQTIAYFQSPNRMGDFPIESPRYGGSPQFNQTAGHVLCCVGNSSRIIPNYVMHMWMATPEDGLAAVLYGPCRLRTLVRDVPVVIESNTCYPFEESIRMTVRSGRPVEFPLDLRIPEWCKTPGITVNGEAVATHVSSHGFVRIDRRWSGTERVTIELPMRPEIVRGRETPFPPKSAKYFQFRSLSKRSDVNEPYASVNYGPLLFAMAIPDKTSNEPVAGAAWNFALDTDPIRNKTHLRIIRRPMPKPWHWQLDGAPIQLRTAARQFDWRPTSTQPLPKEPVTGGKTATITLVPYGCTKFRISMFPVTERFWNN